MKLPNLPKKHNQKESSFGIKLKAFYTKEKPSTASLEIKQTTTDSISFSEVKQAQLDYALAIRGDKGVWIRVVPIIEGMPDYIWLRREQSWVVIKYPKGVVWISPDRFIAEREISKRRSLTFARAKEIASQVIHT